MLIYKYLYRYVVCVCAHLKISFIKIIKTFIVRKYGCLSKFLQTNGFLKFAYVINNKAPYFHLALHHWLYIYIYIYKKRSFLFRGMFPFLQVMLYLAIYNHNTVVCRDTTRLIHSISEQSPFILRYINTSIYKIVSVILSNSSCPSVRLSLFWGSYYSISKPPTANLFSRHGQG